MRLLTGAMDGVKDLGAFELCSCVRKTTEASIRAHRKCGFEIVSASGFDYLADKKNDRLYGIRF